MSQRYAVYRSETAGIEFDWEGQRCDGVELTLFVSSASQPGQLNPIRFVILKEGALTLADSLVLSAKGGGATPMQAPGATQ